MIDTSKPRPVAAPLREPGRETLRAPVQAVAPGVQHQAGSHQAGPRQAGPRQAGPAAPRGSVWLHGIHAVAAALANPNRRLKRLVATEEGETALAMHAPLPWPLAPERMERARLDHLLGRDTVHQGVALLADLLTPPALTAVLAKPGPLLVLDQVTDPRNIGATLRSAAAFGAAGVILQERNAPEETGVMAKAASGALETVPLLRAVNLARTLVALKAAGLWVVGLDAAGPPLRGTALRERRVVLVLGAEGDGMRRLTRETCDELVGLAMPGVMESLNVSAAATLALYELTRPD
jgi:23S rRNA (guanosine2251-2'-O)-methyltransferase